MARKIRNEFYKQLTYKKLMEAHKKSQKCKSHKEDIILFNLKQEEYIEYLYNSIKTGSYKHGNYKVFYVKEPKLRKIEKARYIDRIVHRWIVDNFLEEYFIKTFIENSYACIKKRGTHKAVLDVQKGMLKMHRKHVEYYIIKTDVEKFLQA